MLSKPKNEALNQRLAAIRALTVEPPSIPRVEPAKEPTQRADGLSLDGITMLQSLSSEDRVALARKCTARHFAPGELIAARFSPGTSVYFLVKGVVRIMHNPGQDGEVTIATVGPGNALGEIAAIDGQGRSAAMVAEQDCILLELSASDFNDLIGTHAQIARDLLRRWAAVIRELDGKVSTLAAGDPEQRVYSELLRLAKAATGGGDRWVIAETPSHREIAAWAQTSRDVVVHVLAELVRDGVVERRLKTLHIHDYDRLRRLAAGGEAEN